MKQQRSERVTPVYYSRNEELLSALTHGAGAVFGIYALISMLLYTTRYGTARAVAASAVYGGALVILYTISTLHHALTHRQTKKVFRVLDHATIFLLIAGTYTPVTLITLRGPLGWTLFGIQWGIAAAGIALGSVSLNQFKKISSLIYFLMGWGIIGAVWPLVTHMSAAGFIYLLGGGIFYSAGILLYRKNAPYCHFLWHLFSLTGSVLQFVAINRYVLPHALS